MPASPENTRGFGRREDVPVPAAGQGKNYLLVVAIKQYQHLPQLPNAVADAKELVKLLTAAFGFESVNVIELYDQAATEENIRHELREMARLISPVDNLLLYFSGHGAYDELLKIGSWLPVGAREEDQGKHLSNNDIHAILRAVAARHIFVVCDACYAGSFFSQYRNTGNQDRLEKLRSRWGLTAGRKEVVKDGRPGEHSPFAISLLRHLRHVDQQIGVADLCALVLEEVGSNNEQLPRGEPLQGLGHEGGQFFFRRKTADTGTPTVRGSERGHLLYNIPARMQRTRPVRCEVRIALDSTQLLRNAGFDPADTKVTSVRVGDTMGVRLVDPLGATFRINAITQEKQFIHPETYTQWVFYVTPLRLGRLPLVVAVAIVELIDGRERAREIVLEETVEVVAELPEQSAVETYRVAGYQFTVGSTGPVSFVQAEERRDTTTAGGGGRVKELPRPTLSPRPARPWRTWVSGIAAVLLVGVAVWLLVPDTGVDQFDDRGAADDVPTVEPVVPGGDPPTAPTLPPLEENRWKRAENLGTAAAYEAYLQDYPNGRYAAEARRRVVQLRPIIPAPEDEPLRPIEELLDRRGSITDPRSGQTFSYRPVGRYVWLDENVAYTGAGKAAGPGLGRLYRYDEARRACPPGFQLPTRRQIADLLQHYGGNAAAFAALRAGEGGIGPWPMAGKISAQGNAIGTGRGGAYWTAQRIGDQRAYALEFDHIARRADWKANYVSDYLSCRCVRE